MSSAKACGNIGYVLMRSNNQPGELQATLSTYPDGRVAKDEFCICWLESTRIGLPVARFFTGLM